MLLMNIFGCSAIASISKHSFIIRSNGITHILHGIKTKQYFHSDSRGKSIAEKVGNAGEEICESRGGKVRGTIRESATRFSI